MVVVDAAAVFATSKLDSNSVLSIRLRRKLPMVSIPDDEYH